MGQRLLMIQFKIVLLIHVVLFTKILYFLEDLLCLEILEEDFKEMLNVLLITELKSVNNLVVVELRQKLLKLMSLLIICNVMLFGLEEVCLHLLLNSTMFVTQNKIMMNMVQVFVDTIQFLVLLLVKNNSFFFFIKIFQGPQLKDCLHCICYNHFTKK